MKERTTLWFEKDMRSDVISEKILIYKQIIVSEVIFIFIVLRTLFNEQITDWIQNIIF